jgi:hypothetical protein
MWMMASSSCWWLLVIVIMTAAGGLTVLRVPAHQGAGTGTGSKPKGITLLVTHVHAFPDLLSRMLNKQ